MGLQHRPRQQWKLEPTEDGYVRFRSVLAGKYLDLYQAFSGNGGRAQIWSDNEGTNQRWILKDVTDKNAIRPSAAQLEKRVKEQVEEAAQEAAKAAKKAARKAPAKKSAVKTTATRTCRAKKNSGDLRSRNTAKPVAPARALQKRRNHLIPHSTSARPDGRALFSLPSPPESKRSERIDGETAQSQKAVSPPIKGDKR